MSVQIKFCGAAGIVTGSCYLITVPEGKFLVDCGMYQGTKTVRELNYGDFGFDAREIEFVLLTHAHIDHSGLLPKLVREGFDGKIYTTQATKDLLAYMLPDSAFIQMSEVERLNRTNRHRGQPEIEPIYTVQHAEACLELIEQVNLDTWLDLPFGIRGRYWNAGHILGSGSIELEIPNEDGKKTHMLFSGDLGPEHKAFHDDPDGPKEIDYVLVESTYGDRERPDYTLESRRKNLRDEILAAREAGGNIVIPSFAVERAQELLLDLDTLMDTGEIPQMTVFIDSPLATKVTEVFTKHQCDMQMGDKGCPFTGKNFKFTESVEESKAINMIRSGAIIMSASGMCEAGRIRHHLRNNLWDTKATVIFVGYQAEGTLGKMLQEGAERVRIHGEEIEVRARIRTLHEYSAHADQSELVAWVKERLPVRKGIFLTHGADYARAMFREKLVAEGIDPKMIFPPMIDDVYHLDGEKPEKIVTGKSRLSAEGLAARDSHNEYASFVLELANTLRGMKGEEARKRLIADLSERVRQEGVAPKKAKGKKG